MCPLHLLVLCWKLLRRNLVIDNFRHFARLLVIRRHISGLVISRTLVNDPRFEILNELDIPFITHGRSHASEETAWIDVDNEKAFFDVTEHLANLGHKRIAHIGGPLKFNFSMQRVQGWERGMQQLELPIPDGFHQVSDLSFEGGKAAMQALLSEYCPLGVVCWSGLEGNELPSLWIRRVGSLVTVGKCIPFLHTGARGLPQDGRGPCGDGGHADPCGRHHRARAGEVRCVA